MLSKQFLVKSLEDETEKYITENHQDLVLQKILSSYIEISVDREEEIISKNLSKYIKEPDFLSLPFNSIHRILTLYNKNSYCQHDQQTEEDIKDFLKNECIKKHPDSTFLIMLELDFVFSDKDYILQFMSKYRQSKNIFLLKISENVIENYKDMSSEKIKKAIQNIENKKKRLF